MFNPIICHLTPPPLSQSTTSFGESGTSLQQTLPPTEEDVESSEGEYEEEEEEEEYEEEEEKVKVGKVQSSVWCFLEAVEERPS